MTSDDAAGRAVKAKRMEQAIRDYFDACNSGDAAAVAACFAPGAVHYFPPDMYGGPFRGGETIGAKWAWAVANLGSHWTVDEVICDPDSGRAVIEWTHEKRKAGVLLRGDEWYRFDPDTGLIAEIRAYYASPQAGGLDRLELGGYPYAERGYAASQDCAAAPGRLPGRPAHVNLGGVMPLVRIDIMEGRPPEKIRELHGRVAALVAEILDTPIDRVRTYITQFPAEGWGIGGVPADVARADEVAARRAAAAQAAQQLDAEISGS